MPRDEARKKYPIPQFISPYERIVEGTGESLIELHSRALVAIQQVFLMPSGKYLIVSHGEILNAALRCMLSIPIPRNATAKEGVFFKFKDTSYANLVYQKKMDKWTLCEFIP